MTAGTDIADQLYESAFIPECWPKTLDGLEAISGSVLASYWLFDGETGLRGIAPKIPPDTKSAFLDGGWRDGPGVRWVLEHKPSRFTDVYAQLPPGAADSDPTWTPMAALGLGSSLASVFPAPSGELSIFMLARMKEQGPYSSRELAALDALRPHLIRSTIIAARLRLERARMMVETLERIGLAAAVIGLSGRVIASNALLEGLPAVVVATAFGGIAINDRVRNEQFLSALSRVGKGSAGPAQSIPVAGDEGQAPHVVHLVPICGQARDVFTGGHALMVVSTLSRKPAPAPELLNGLFDLSPAEARLVDQLMTGATLREIAVRTDHSVTTLRNQMRAVLAKTGVRRQAELTQLLASL